MGLSGLRPEAGSQLRCPSRYCWTYAQRTGLHRRSAFVTGANSTPHMTTSAQRTNLGSPGLPGDHASGGTDAYAEFASTSCFGEAWKILADILADLAKDVPRLRTLTGVSVGSVDPLTPSSDSTETVAVPRFQVVGGTGFENVTPTMSR